MTNITMPDFNALNTEMKKNSLAVTTPELHGLLTGMLCGGLTFDNKRWKPLLFDYTNEGMAWPSDVMKMVEQLFQHTMTELTSDNFLFTLAIPNESEDLVVRADGLSEWVNHFISGLGLIEFKIEKASESLKEALADLEEIARLGIDEDDDMKEQEVLFFQVVAHVQVCVLTIYAEFGQKVYDGSKTIH